MILEAVLGKRVTDLESYILDTQYTKLYGRVSGAYFFGKDTDHLAELREVHTKLKALTNPKELT